MKLLQLSTLVAAVFLSASCAQKWDEAKKTSLSTLAVTKPVIAHDAYQNPVGRMPSHGAPIVTTPGAGFAAGAVGNGLAQLIVEGIGSAQQNMYDRANGDAISRAAGTVPKDLDKRIHKAVIKELESGTFFSGKLRDKSSNKLVVKVDAYGYVRTIKKDGRILMTPQIIGSFEITDAAGKSLLAQPISGVSAEHARPLEEFVQNPKLAGPAFDKASEYMATQITAAIKTKAGDEPSAAS